MKNGVDIDGTNDMNYEIGSVISIDSGTYNCKISNSIAEDLTLHCRSVNLHVKLTSAFNDDISIDSPQQYNLSQNYPNPFNPITKIRFSIPKSAHVFIRIYDLLGQQVAILLNAKKQAGYYSVLFNGQNYSGGVYFYEIRTQKFHKIKKCY